MLIFQYQELDAHFCRLSDMRSICEFGDISQFGILNHLFNKGDDLLYKDIFGFIDMYTPISDFDSYFTAAYQRKIECEISELKIKKIDAQSASIRTTMYDMQISAAEEKLLVESIQDYKDQEENGFESYIDLLVAEYCFWNEGMTEAVAWDHVLKFYLPYKIASVLYDDYTQRMSRNEIFEDRLPVIVKEKYLKNKIDLKAIDKEFSSYNLVSLVDGMEIINAHESQTLTDNRILGWYLYLKVPRDLLSAIEDLLQKEMVNKIAFWINGVAAGVPALEELEIGRYFSFDALALPALSRLYDDENYDDKLWIKVEINENEEKYPHSMTFEEICSDDAQVEGRIITQVIHLEFKKIDNDYFISHLDHEFISYNPEQYNARKVDGSVKGVRQKTFKIDDAKIPFKFKFNDKYFMYILLDCLLQNKKNVNEYFSKILNK
ncbi:hypothetical protein Gbfr_027_020 [Gluconobacter frateurii M-2]|nr:hypothetical protein Gbfr_027_020 [Gluconobacter frateurii M-2]